MESHKTYQQLQEQLEDIRQAPSEMGQVALIVCRPDVGERRVLQVAELSRDEGLISDSWRQRIVRKSPAAPLNRDVQITLMNLRSIRAIESDPERWPLAGDQFYVDLDLSANNIPPGTHLEIGKAVIQVSAEPHLGCRKFSQRFGRDAALFVNSAVGKQLNLRGINARVVIEGEVKMGDPIRVLNQ